MYAIMDEGTDEPFAGKGCSVLKAHGKYRICQGREHELVDVAVTLVDPAQGNKRAMVLVINRCLYAPDDEPLIPGHMLEWAGISCCSRQKSHGGKQRILAHRGKETPSGWMVGSATLTLLN
jgi:hypothetical protein